jgi:integrase
MSKQYREPRRGSLTQLAIERLKEPGIHWDTHLPGFGIRITPKGKKSWVCFYRVSRRAVIETLGTVAMIPKVEDARNMARQSQLTARTGINPVQVKRDKQELESLKDLSRFKSVVDTYFKRRVSDRQKTATMRETMRIFEKEFLPKWGDHHVAAILSKDIRRLLDEIVERGSPASANAALRNLKAFYRWAVRNEFLDKNPAINVDAPITIKSRDRILTDEEIVLFWSACESLGWPYGSLFKILLLTGQRRDEVAEMTRSELDLEKRLWILPAQRAKNGSVHEVQLSDLAVEILQSLPIINNSKYVFTVSGGAPVNGWSAAKTKLDKLIGDIPEWRLHDLRRTAASGMARRAIAPNVVDKILNHSSGTIRGVAAVYNRFEYGPERKTALEAWARYIESLIHPSGDENVVPIAARRISVDRWV